MLKQIKQRLENMRTVSRLLSNAEQIANGKGEKHPGAEHLVLAAFAMPDGTAAQAFRQIAGEPALFDAELARQQSLCLQQVGIDTTRLDLNQQDVAVAQPTMPIAQVSAQNVLRDMAGATGFWQAMPITGLDVLLAVARQKHGLAPKVLESLGISGEALENLR